MKINIQNLSFGRWMAVCNLLKNYKVVKDVKILPPGEGVCVLFNNNEIFTEYHFYNDKQTFNMLPLIDIMLFLRSLTHDFWIKCYYVQALNCLRKKERFLAKKYVLLALNVYLSKQNEDTKEYICAQIMKGSLIHAD